MRPNVIKQDVLAGKPVAGAMVFEFFSPGMSAILVAAHFHAGAENQD